MPHACHRRVFHQRSRRALLRLKTNRLSHTQPAPFPLAYDPAPYRNRPDQANLEPDPIVEDDDHVANAECETQVPEERPLSPRQLALWRAVQEAKVQGIPLREIARQLGISRNTVRKYARALTQPTNRPHNRGARRLPQLTAKRWD